MASPDESPSLTGRHDDLFRWVGICFKEWASLEAHLFTTCLLVLGADATHVAIIYYRTPTLDARLTLADELLRTRMSGRDLVAWKKLLVDVRALLPIRNLLAHSPIATVRQTEWLESDETGQIEPIDTNWLEIATSPWEQLRGRPERSIKDEELPDHFRQVHSVSLRLGALNAGLHRKRPARRVGRARRKSRR
jgi:hypothetical protein